MRLAEHLLSGALRESVGLWTLLELGAARSLPCGSPVSEKVMTPGFQSLEKAVLFREFRAEEGASWRSLALEKTRLLQVSPRKRTFCSSPARKKVHTGDTGWGCQASTPRGSPGEKPSHRRGIRRASVCDVRDDTRQDLELIPFKMTVYSGHIARTEYHWMFPCPPLPTHKRNCW